MFVPTCFPRFIKESRSRYQPPFVSMSTGPEDFCLQVIDEICVVIAILSSSSGYCDVLQLIRLESYLM